MREVPLSEFRVPGGMIGMTLDLHGIEPFTVMIPVEKIEEQLAVTEAALGIKSRERRRVEEHVRVRRVLFDTLSAVGREDKTFGPAAMSFLWAALNHPTGGNDLRALVAGALRAKGSAHLTVVRNEKGHFAFGMGDGGDRALDLDVARQMLAAAPKDRAIVIQAGQQPEKPLH